MSNLPQHLTFDYVIPRDSRWLKRVRQYIRFHYYRYRCRNELNVLMTHLQQYPHWQDLFTDMPFRFSTLLNKYCDKRWDKSARLEAILQHFNRSDSLFSVDFCRRLLNEKRIELFRLDDIVIYLSLNDIEPSEGFFAVNLYCGEERVYNASFAFLAQNQCLIASIQGTNIENAQELIKQTTKKLHGIRPMFMLIYVCKLLAKHYDLQLLGITHKNQAKYRFNDNTRLLFNYDEFWQENEATFDTSSGFWKLNNHIERRALEDIQSKKRSMYRKRYEMLDMLENNLQQILPR